MIVIVTGERNVGKTTVVERVVSRLEARDHWVVGFYTVDTPAGLDLVDARTGDRVPFATRSGGSADDLEVGRFHVDRTAIERGLTLADRPGDFLVVDEIGSLERRKEGFYPLLESLQPERYRGILLAVREGVSGFVADHVPENSSIVTFQVTEKNRETLPSTVVASLLDASAE